MKTILNPAAAIGAIALALLTGPRAANATSYTITVDASKQTAGNPPFWAASVGTGTASLTLRSDLETHYKIGNREAGLPARARPRRPERRHGDLQGRRARTAGRTSTST